MTRQKGTEVADVLGPLLRELREKAGLSQLRLEERSGISATHISRLETGKPRNVRRDTVNRLLDAMDPAAAANRPDPARERPPRRKSGAGRPGPSAARSPRPRTNWPPRAGAAGSARRSSAWSSTRIRFRCAGAPCPPRSPISTPTSGAFRRVPWPNRST
ncbi:helix-turn-helix domain-containing protein [Streptomyces parvulus]|uniref:helix-turn-helix domain-containing protein n=1 Tax=Streptomyces parvulus TaxID=146923 RepID=UPI0033C583DC